MHVIVPCGLVQARQGRSSTCLQFTSTPSLFNSSCWLISFAQQLLADRPRLFVNPTLPPRARARATRGSPTCLIRLALLVLTAPRLPSRFADPAVVSLCALHERRSSHKPSFTLVRAIPESHGQSVRPLRFPSTSDRPSKRSFPSEGPRNTIRYQHWTWQLPCHIGPLSPCTLPSTLRST